LVDCCLCRKEEEEEEEEGEWGAGTASRRSKNSECTPIILTGTEVSPSARHSVL